MYEKKKKTKKLAKDFLQSYFYFSFCYVVHRHPTSIPKFRLVVSCLHNFGKGKKQKFLVSLISTKFHIYICFDKLSLYLIITPKTITSALTIAKRITFSRSRIKKCSSLMSIVLTKKWRKNLCF